MVGKVIFNSGGGRCPPRTAGWPMFPLSELISPSCIRSIPLPLRSEGGGLLWNHHQDVHLAAAAYATAPDASSAKVCYLAAAAYATAPGAMFRYLAAAAFATAPGA